MIQPKQVIGEPYDQYKQETARVANMVMSMRVRLPSSLAFTPGIGRYMAMVRITDDPDNFVHESSKRIHNRLDQLRKEHGILYHCLSIEFVILRDPHDRELHMLKQRLLEKARGRE